MPKKGSKKIIPELPKKETATMPTGKPGKSVYIKRAKKGVTAVAKGRKGKADISVEIYDRRGRRSKKPSTQNVYGGIGSVGQFQSNPSVQRYPYAKGANVPYAIASFDVSPVGALDGGLVQKINLQNTLEQMNKSYQSTLAMAKAQEQSMKEAYEAANLPRMQMMNEEIELEQFRRAADQRSPVGHARGRGRQ